MNNSAESSMADLGVSKTVYSLVYPETKETFLEVISDPELPEDYEDAYTKKQDSMHGPFFQAYVDWSREVADIDLSTYTNLYPCNGSTEGIRESISFHASVQRALGNTPRIHVFEGEYEGYRAYAEAHGVEVVVHPRDNFEDSFTELTGADRFYISQPSGIDGNIWPEFDRFMEFLKQAAPEMPVMLDLAYLGTVADPDYIINTTHQNIDALFFSLSKSFGVYYHRIGGVMSKTAIPGLYGNMWFKNLLALRYGKRLMEKYPIHALPQKYKAVQEKAVEKLNQELSDSEPVVASDVVLLATQKSYGKDDDPMKIALKRAGKVRFCLTPSIDQQIKN